MVGSGQKRKVRPVNVKQSVYPQDFSVITTLCSSIIDVLEALQYFLLSFPFANPGNDVIQELLHDHNSPNGSAKAAHSIFRKQSSRYSSAHSAAAFPAASQLNAIVLIGQ